MLAGAASTVLSGCAAIPKVGPAPQAKAASAYAASQSFSAPAADWPQDRWWTEYQDPQLDKLIEEALAGSPDLAAAQARVDQSDALAEQVESTLGPHIEAVAMAGESKLSYDNGLPPAIVTHGWRDAGLAGLNLNWQIDFFGKNRALLAAATSGAQAARAEQAAARLTLSTAVAGAYADLAQLYEDRDAAVDALRVRTESQDLINQRFAQGLETRAAGERAEAGRASMEAELAAVDEAIGLTKNRIATLVGQGPDLGLSIDRPRPGSIRPFGLPADLQADLVGRRPDVVAARLAAEAAAHRVKAAKANFYPNVNLAALAGYESLGLANLAKAGSQFGTVGPAVTLPIFESGRLEGAYRGARADYDAAVAVYDQALSHALAEVADGAISARALDTRLAKSREALKAAQSAYDLAKARYGRGIGTYLDVLSAEDSLISDRRAVADLETRAFTLDVALIRALGGGYRA
jgi:NodT family efflux transporter outer membrane factor (OMF) lipoprotein